ncbi:uncharacterized protein L201_007451 [Kwoniella dendrophila CBS 6074]|uniref:C2H2-type domain-containing protein n=1 Tax=Kwoniella dendrophila CBS 6074 TaxID=1295534 RepID=A0AAX4K4E9_9TREE
MFRNYNSNCSGSCQCVLTGEKDHSAKKFQSRSKRSEATTYTTDKCSMGIKIIEDPTNMIIKKRTLCGGCWRDPKHIEGHYEHHLTNTPQDQWDEATEYYHNWKTSTESRSGHKVVGLDWTVHLREASSRKGKGLKKVQVNVATNPQQDLERQEFYTGHKEKEDDIPDLDTVTNLTDADIQGWYLQSDTTASSVQYLDRQQVNIGQKEIEDGIPDLKTITELTDDDIMDWYEHSCGSTFAPSH